ncbi:MAG: hypothetical protein NVV73_23065 [Cellvibrionaceae bacterium]|nr:hypothetical protein [Cellvibrionaceae bacterium]
MTSINNTLINRFAAAQQAAKADPEHLLSNRHRQSLEQTTSKARSDGAHSDSASLTYTNRPSDGKGGRTVISSQRATNTSASPATSEPVRQFERMNAAKALVARHLGGTHTETGNRPQTGELLDLTVRTKDGDTITLKISSDLVLNKKDGGTSLDSESHFSFVVAGELSDKEREAVDALVNRLGEIAGDYQNDGWADVTFLDAVDGDFIAGLDLSVAGNEGNTLSITYSLNSATGTHTLAVDQNDYEYEINAEAILDSTNLPLKDNEIYLQYQQILMDTARSYKAGEFSGGAKSTDATEFFLDGLEAIFTPLTPDHTDSVKASQIDRAESKNAEAPGKINSEQKTPAPHSDSEGEKTPQSKSTTEDAFLSGIPDFSASFNTPLFTPNASNLGEVSQMSLTMEQSTDISIKRGMKTVEQNYSYESTVSQHFGIGGDSIEHANLADEDQPGGQTYLHEVVKQAANMTRILDMDTNGNALAYTEEKESTHVEKDQISGERRDHRYQRRRPHRSAGKLLLRFTGHQRCP